MCTPPQALGGCQAFPRFLIRLYLHICEIKVRSGGQATGGAGGSAGNVFAQWPVAKVDDGHADQHELRISSEAEVGTSKKCMHEHCGIKSIYFCGLLLGKAVSPPALMEVDATKAGDCWIGLNYKLFLGPLSGWWRKQWVQHWHNAGLEGKCKLMIVVYFVGCCKSFHPADRSNGWRTWRTWSSLWGRVSGVKGKVSCGDSRAIALSFDVPCVCGWVCIVVCR